MGAIAVGVGVGAAIAGVGFGSSLNSKKKANKAKKAQRQRLIELENIAKGDRKWYDENIRPLELSIAKDANIKVDPEYYADKAQGDVTQQFALAKQGEDRRLRSYGINPSDPNYNGFIEQLMIAQAAAEAGARNKGRETALNFNMTEPFNRKMQAVNLNRSGGDKDRIFGQTGNVANYYGSVADQKNQQRDDEIALGMKGLSMMMSGMGGMGGGGAGSALSTSAASSGGVTRYNPNYGIGGGGGY